MTSPSTEAAGQPRSGSVRIAAPDAGSPVQNLLLTLPFLAFFYAQLAHHQMWRDELNAFGLAAASPDLRALFHNVHYEGHPWLWYFILWIAAHVHPYPVAMKVVQAVVGTGIYLMIGLASPFRRLEKLLLFLCYFVSFEYTVMSRMYGLVFLLALVYIWRRAHRPTRVLGNAVVLGLMACCDLTGCVVSFALILEYLWSTFRPDTGSWQPAASPKRNLLGAAAVYAAFALSAVLSLLPARDISKATTVELMTRINDYKWLGGNIVSYIVKPYTPTVTGKPGIFWGVSAAAHNTLFALGVPLVLAAYWFIFRRNRNLLLLVGTVCLLMTTIGFVVYHGSVRHFGMTFLAFLLGLWMLRATRQAIAWPAYVLLGLTAIGGVVAAIGSWQRPFSQSGATAIWLKTHGLEDRLAGFTGDTTIGVAEQLHRPIFEIPRGAPESFFRFDRASDSFEMTDFIPRLRMAAQYYGGGYTLVDETQISPVLLTQAQAQGLTIRPLISFTGAEVPGEDFYVYAVTPSAAPAK